VEQGQNSGNMTMNQRVPRYRELPDQRNNHNLLNELAIPVPMSVMDCSVLRLTRIETVEHSKIAYLTLLATLAQNE
jgi:hypothetical protein